MGHQSSKSFLERIRGARDSAMEDLAKVTLAWTSSHTFQSINAAIARPVLLANALFRKARESAMADVLARLNMPSREDVLTLSQRLTRIEMVLDDVGAGLEQVRRAASQKSRPATRESTGEGRTGPLLAKEG